MSFLKQLGAALNAGLALTSVLTPALGPLIAALAPKTAPAIQNIQDELPKIAAAVMQIEAVGQALGLGGPDKLRLVVPLVTQIMLASPLMTNKRIQDQEAFKRGVTSISQGMVDVLNSLEAVPVQP